MADYDWMRLCQALREVLPEELRQRRDEFAARRLSGLALCCDPPAGRLALSALVETDAERKWSHGSWEHSHFTDRNATDNWARLKGPLGEMKEFWKAFSRQGNEAADAFARSVIDVCNQMLNEARSRGFECLRPG